MSIIFPPVAGLTTTSGTGSFTISAPLPVPGTSPVINYLQWNTVANGSRVLIIRADTGNNNYEIGHCDVSVSGGTVTLTFNSRILTSAGGATPVSWPGGGIQNVWTVPYPIDPSNGGSEFGPYAAAFRASIGVQTTTDLGNVAGAIVQLISGGAIPSGVILPTHYHTNLINTVLTGGSNSKILRKVLGSSTLTNASLSDSPSQLQIIYARGSDGQLYKRGAVPFTGVVQDQRYYLYTNGDLATTFSNGVNDTPDGTHTQLVVGYGIASGVLDLDPQRPIGGVLSSGVALKLEGGDLKV